MKGEYRAQVKGIRGVKPCWAYGDKFRIGNRVFIVFDDAEYDPRALINGIYQEAIGGFIEVIPETVGRWTGLKDKDKKDIYNGASIRYWSDDRKSSAIHKVIWDDSKMGYVLSQEGMGDADEGYWMRDWYTSRAEVIDAPELLTPAGKDQ